MTSRSLLLCVIVLLCQFRSSVAVSFYGESYIHIPYGDDLHQTNLELRFKASRPYGVLVLLTGTYDFFLLQLHAGTIQLKANYGGEETMLDLGRHRYDDLEWHTVKVTSSDDIITMVIDDFTSVRERIKGTFRHLNIDGSIYLGGIDKEANGLFEEDLKNLRGTFSNAVFNGKDLISMAKQLTDPRKVVEVSWDIDTIFDAPRDSPITFTSETSFASFSHIHPSNERTVSFLLKTESTTALLLYSFTHHSTERYFIALEILERQLKLSVGTENEVTSVSADTVLGSEWHQIDLSVTPRYLELSVDGVRNSKQIQSKTSAIYGGLIFIGGIDHKVRSWAIDEGLESLEGQRSLKGSINGCIRNVVISSRAYDIHDIHASRLIGYECDLDINCVKGDCGSRPSSAEFIPRSDDSNQDDAQILSVNPVMLFEGGQVEVTTDNIEIVYNFKHYGIRESRIMFYVVDPPKYGEIEVDLGRRRKSDVFTYLDVIGEKVRYIHRGTEQSADEVGMELEIVTSNRNSDNVPEAMQERYAFILPIIIKPTNDPPKIVLGNQGVIRIIENTKIRITSDFLYTEDSDTPANELIYLVVKTPSQGYFEKVGWSGTPVTQFTQEEVNKREIWFLHLGTGDVTVGVKVSDGRSSSDPAIIFVKTVQLQLMVLKNSGLVLPHGSFSLITNENLTTVSNVPTQELEITYDILQSPRYGVLERQQFVNGEWEEVNSFAQRHVDNGHVRYRYRQEVIGENPPSDQFKFHVKAKSKTTPFYYFRIQFQQIYLEIEASKLTLLDKPYGVLSSENLKASTNNPQLLADKITFTIVRPPSMGDFYLLHPRRRLPDDFSLDKPLTSNTPFTQATIDAGKIYYRLKANTYENIEDFSDLRVQTVGTTDKIVRLWIEYVPLKSDVTFVNNGLTNVIEGGQKTIERNALFIQTDEFRVFEFTVITKPQHGALQLVDSRSSAVISDDIDEFTSDDIKNLRLVYKHDDSEFDKDSFTFTAVPQMSRTSLISSNIPEFPGTFEIKMLMRNDNAPERLVNKVFKVVRNGEKLITIDDIAFTDPDIDYNTGELSYTRRGISNGQIVGLQNKNEQIFQFTQTDILNGKILFKHIGDDKGRADIYVTDGQFYSNCLLEIQAGDPYVNIRENTGAVVRSNSVVEITAQNLSIDTNINAADSDIHFVLSEEPTQGHLEVEGVEVNEFNLKTLKSNKLLYRHTGDARVEDYFKFSVIAGEWTAEGRFSVKILLESSQLPPRVVNNRVLEGHIGQEPNVIQQKHLLITHTDSSENDIEYLILVLPKHGDLFVHGSKLMADKDITFTQLDVNNGDVTYVLENTSATEDKFIFEVSNGFESLRGLEFLIDIVPYSLPFQVKNFTVIEGGKKILNNHLLKVADKYTNGNELLFTITSPPNFGRVELSSNKGTAISTFTSIDLQNRKVAYVHDNSESKMDWFSISVSLLDESKRSEIQTVYTEIEGINDEAPVVVKNAGLNVWQGSMTQITLDILSARDPDSSASELEYRISSPTNGHISMLNNTFKSLASFRQSWIDDGYIVFVHEGATSGDFSFQVSDGTNTSPLSVFHIVARQLVLTLHTNTLLHAYPNTMQPITASHLLAVTNDPDQFKPIIYTVTVEPRHGSIVTMVDGARVKVSSFNQADINASLIYYKHSGDLNGWTQDDSLEFTVNTLYAERLRSQVLEIYVSYANLNAENKNQLIKTSPIKVDEGAEMLVMKSNLDVSEFVRNLERIGKRASLRFSLRNAPRHGTLVFRRLNLLKNVRFSQRDINSHQLMYKHDDSDTIFDTFNLTLHLRIEDQSAATGANDETTFNLVINVTIQPVNDEPFKLLTTSPSLRVVQGFMAVINQSVLNTVDKDTTPEYIVYKIHREAVNGHVALIDNPSKKIDVFTQQDINEDRVVFQHVFRGEAGQAESSTFNFHVSDGSSPYYQVFQIYVTKIFVDMTHNSTLFMIQSNSSASLLQKNINVSTNGLREKVVYSILNQPRFGKIYVSGKVSNSFSQQDVDRSLVMYLQSDLSSGSDLFEISVLYRNDLRSKITFYNRVAMFIRVKPLVATGPLEAPKGERVAITLLSLDASLLAERTGDNPVYDIRHGPYFGNIVKSSVSKRQIYSESYKGRSGFKTVREFSHEDVVYMKVFYKSDVYNTHNNVQDNFTFVLRAFGAQPAEGVFNIGLMPSENTPLIPVTMSPGRGDKPLPDNPVTQSSGEFPRGDNSPGNETIEPSRLKHDHVIILAVSIPLLLVITITILIICFVWKNRRKQDYTPTSKKSPRLRPHISGPLQIEQPHVHIQPQEQGSPVSDESKSLIVEYENTSHIPGTSRGQHSEESDLVMPMIMTLPGQEHIPLSPDISRTEVSRMVPTCKVTPLYDNGETEGAVGYTDDNRHSISSMGDMIEWITNDPELLQHCSSSSPPVLRNSQYWV